MALIKKDGSIYELINYNPIIANQNQWKWQFFGELGTKVLYDQNLNIIDFSYSEVEEKQEIEPIRMNTESIKADFNVIERSKVQVWCLPAYIEETFDAMYGESKRKVKYKEKFIFEGIIQAQEDFGITILTTTEITLNSVIYPRNSDKRWWKIVDVKKNGEFFLIRGGISTYEPRFA